MRKTKRRPTKKKHPGWELRLYVADTSPRSVLATGNLQSLCEQYLQGNYRVTIIDIVKKPHLARANDILATPTLVRVFPGPQKTVIGTLSDTEQVLKALEVRSDREQIAAMLSAGVSQIGHA